MSKMLAYAIVGRGRWAARMKGTLESLGRGTVVVGETRRRDGESEEEWSLRLETALGATKAEISWVCLPPGPHVAGTVRASIALGMSVVAEKPWDRDAQETKSLKKEAERRGVITGVHFEYCFLDEVTKWRREFYRGKGLRFGGRFVVPERKDPNSMPANQNLGSHLLAAKEYAVPDAETDEVVCGYGDRAERRMWIQKEGKEIGAVNFLENRQPIIQRFIAAFEGARERGSFEMDLEFGVRVAEAVARLR